jgi:chitin-binding protein
MTSKRIFAVAATVAVAAATLAAAPAYAHGTMQYPISRGYGCYLDNPESPSLPACQAVVAAQGPQGLYDWMAENILDAAGRSRQIIPDGKLCSANKPEFRGLDLGRADWPTTTMTAGSTLTLRFIGTAPHKGTFQVYMTHAGYDPRTPLRWSDLQPQPFLTVADPPLVDGVYQLKATLPAGITGRNLIYTVWQRSDSDEAFYSCSDVMLTGGATAPRPTVSP